MTLLQEIQRDAVEGKAMPLVLRKAKILAARLRHEPFKVWVEHELNGYPSKEAIPAYRILQVHSVATFSGPFGRGLRNVPIPATALPAPYRSRAA